MRELLHRSILGLQVVRSDVDGSLVRPGHVHIKRSDGKRALQISGSLMISRGSMPAALRRRMGVSLQAMRRDKGRRLVRRYVAVWRKGYKSGLSVDVCNKLRKMFKKYHAKLILRLSNTALTQVPFVKMKFHASKILIQAKQRRYQNEERKFLNRCVRHGSNTGVILSSAKASWVATTNLAP